MTNEFPTFTGDLIVELMIDPVGPAAYAAARAALAAIAPAPRKTSPAAPSGIQFLGIDKDGLAHYAGRVAGI